ncbi:hypothetical protein [Inhella proteolytica]|nr:hypothetical protein [Inhella proteolytica]
MMQAMRLDPFEAVDGLSFALLPPELVQQLGWPQHERRNAVGLNEYDYEERILRFQDSGRLEEVTVRAWVLHLGSLAIPFAHLEAFVRTHDPECFERAGFLVSPRYGFAFAPDCPPWITALAPHGVEAWRRL